MSNRRVELLLSCLILPLLSACGGSTKTCVDRDEPYMDASSNPPLRVPDGLTAPERSVLTIPDVNPPSARAPGSGCLAEPPSYFRSAGTVARSVEEVVASWAQAWATRDADAVIALYSSGFTAPTESAGSATWLDQRREQVATGPVPESMVDELKVESVGPDRQVATFKQNFGANSLAKQLTLVREDGSWRIVDEKVVEVR